MVKKVKSWGTAAEGKHAQGDFVLIDDDQFDPEFHEEIAEPKPAKPTKANKASSEQTPA